MRKFKKFLGQTRFVSVICVFLFFACDQKNSTPPFAADKRDPFKPPDTIPVKDPMIVYLDTCPSPLTVIIPERKADSFVLKTKDFTKVIHSPKVIQANLFVPVQLYNTSDGLSLNTVRCSFVDSKGNLWFGTRGSGVSRYDGKSFMNYSVSHGLAGNNIYSILEDNMGNLWFGTLGGLSCYNGKTFTNYTTEQGLPSYAITSILQDQNGNIWLGTSNGISKLPYGKTDFLNYAVAEGLSSNDISCMLEDKNGDIWIGTAGGGLNHYDGKSFINYTTSQGLADNFVNSIAEDKNQNLCIGTQNGISFYDGKSFTNFSTAQGLAGNDVSSILKDKNGNLWFGTATGASLYNENPLPESKLIFTNYTTLNGLPNNRITSIVEDKSNNIWFTSTNGVFRLDRDWILLTDNNAGFSSYMLTDDVANNSVTSILEDSKKNLWFGTLGAGVFRLSQDEKTFTIYTAAQGLPNDDVRNIAEDSKGNLWFVTNQGIARLDKNWKAFTTYTTKQGLVNEIGTSMVQDKSGNLWFGTRGGGVSMLDKEWKSFTTYTTTQGLPNNIVRNLIEDKKGNLWFGTLGGGLSRLDKNHAYFTSYTTDNGLITDYVWNVFEDNNANIWLAAEVGLIRFDGKSFTNYTTAQGLGDNGIGDILLSKNGAIWIGTNSGISELKGYVQVAKNNGSGSYIPASNPLTNLELSTAFNPDLENYNVKTGHPINDINMNGMFMTKNDVIWAGTSDKLVRVDFNSLHKNPNPPNVFIQGLKINNENISWYDIKEGKENTDSLSLSPNITEQINLFGKVLNAVELNRIRKKFRNIEFDSITSFYALPINLVLPYQFNNITLDFAAIEPAKPQLVKYQYMLEGYNKDWNPATNQTTATFGNVYEGSYTFKLKAQSPDGVWSVPLLYTFKVLPPWYRTWLAYILYALLIGTLAYWFYRFQLSRKLAVLESLRLKEINQLKSSLYTNITHEFRTPLTVILGMAESVKSTIKEKQFDDVEESLDMIQRNGKNLLRLVNEMMDLAKLESGNMELQLVQADVVSFIKYICESFHSLAKASQIDLTVYSEIDELVMDFDANKLTSITTNLLSNAIKFTPSGGTIVVHLNIIVEKGLNYFFLRIKDNGMGISEEVLPHIFDRFYQADSSSSRRSEGTGIGLALTKEFTELLGGVIEVKSTVGKGSIFNLIIPITKNAPKTEDVRPSNTIALYSEKTRIPIEEALESDTQLPLLLIIEDNADVAHYLKSCLKGKYEILYAADGIIGIEMAYEKVPDIIICDVMMPGKDGYEVCATLKSDERTDHIPIIMLTAKITQQDRITGLSHGADAYLAKPFNKVELFTHLDQLVLLRQKMVQKFEREGFVQLIKVRAENPETKFLKNAVKIIQEKMGDHSFGSRHLARQLSMSESQIYRKLKAMTGKSTAIFIRSVRLQKAKELIQTTNSNVSEVAYDVGFNDLSWFSRAFKEEFGFAPSEHRK
jgi:signal transduction histidine kinase/ligand-binding sensor domain-containing protein/DNA-binding response OmpR family regulator